VEGYMGGVFWRGTGVNLRHARLIGWAPWGRARAVVLCTSGGNGERGYAPP